MAKFVVFEKVSELVYQQVDKSKASSSTNTIINLGSGLMAGFAAAIVSQPADTMLSKINKTKGLPGEGTISRLVKIGKELGFRGSYAGIGARLFMVGTLVSAVWERKLSFRVDTNQNPIRLLVNSQSTATSRRRLAPPEAWKSQSSRMVHSDPLETSVMLQHLLKSPS
jgi:hypothetical protein